MQLNHKFDSSIVRVNNSAIRTYNSSQIRGYKTWQSLIKVTLGTAYLVAILALPTMACGPSFPNSQLFASQLLILPAIASLYRYGLPLIAIVIIEAYILHKREDLPFFKAFFWTIFANLFYLIACGISFTSFSVIFPGSLIGSAISAAMCVYFCQRTGYLKNLSQGIFIFLVYLFFIGLGFASSLLAASINISADRTLLYAATGGIISIGFIFSFVAKGYAISLNLPEKRPSFAATAMSMQVGSFPVVAIAYYLMQNQPW